MPDLVFELFYLAMAGMGVLGTSVAGARYSLAPYLDHRWRMQGVRREVAALERAFAARPAPRHRHDGHCLKCGKFAAIVSVSPRGLWTRCKAHGVQARLIRRIGRPERLLVRVVLHDPIDGLEPPCETSPLAISAPARDLDFLDGLNVRPFAIPLRVAA